MKTNCSTMKWVSSCLLFSLALIPNLKGADNPLHLAFRSSVKASGGVNETFSVMEKKAAWASQKTADIICDMWDDHWCKSASRRVDGLAGPVNEVVKTARAKGAFTIHAPSSGVNFYKGTPQRKRTQAAPFVKPPALPICKTRSQTSSMQSAGPLGEPRHEPRRWLTLPVQVDTFAAR